MIDDLRNQLSEQAAEVAAEAERRDRYANWRQLRGQLTKITNELRKATMLAFELGEDELGRDLREMKGTTELAEWRANEEIQKLKPEVER